VQAIYKTPPGLALSSRSLSACLVRFNQYFFQNEECGDFRELGEAWVGVGGWTSPT